MSIDAFVAGASLLSAAHPEPARIAGAGVNAG
jgi:hypothetical protein